MFEYSLLTSILLLLFASLSFAQIKNNAQKGDSIPERNSMIDKNFISNPDAETKSAINPLPFWDNVTLDSKGNKLVSTVFYGAQTSDIPSFPVLKSGYGTYYFNSLVGGDQKEVSAFQYVDLAPLAESIDSGRISYNMSGYFGGVADAFAMLNVKFLSGPGTDIGSFYTNNIVDEERNQDSLVLLPRVKAGDVPVGSRKMVIQLKFFNLEGESIVPAFADNLSVILLRKP